MEMHRRGEGREQARPLGAGRRSETNGQQQRRREMSSATRKRWALSGALLGVGTTLALVIGLGVLAGAGVAASAAAPVNTSPPTIKGTPQEGQKLTGDEGSWSGNPTDLDDFWMRCDKDGGSCAKISGATSKTYTLGSADVGNTLRFRVEATNSDGTTSSSSVPTAVIAAATKPVPVPPQATSPPTITGTAQEGQKLTGGRGTWSGRPTDYNYYWMRCDKNGASCADIGGAGGTTYTLTSASVGNTVRFKVGAANSDGRTFASSAPTAVIVAATKPPPVPATGCPSGTGSVQVTSVGPPARLLLDQQQQSPSLINRTTRQLILRYHVSACGGRSAQGALVYATALPFTQLTIPAEQTTNSDGWVELVFRMRATFRVDLGPIVIFVRARKPGENLLGGISSRRLFSVRVSSR